MEFNEFIAHLSSFSSEERGKRFERYCKRFLENDPRYASQLKKVWLWKDWPGNWGRDKGIDLIAETHTGKIWAIQAKAYDSAYYITKDDVDRFLSESSRKIIHFRLFIATTNNIGPNAQEVISAQEKPVSLCLSNHLEEAGLDWSSVLENSQKPSIKKEPLHPRPHQEKALQDILQGFQTHPYGQLHMACGTGKTLVGLWLAERLEADLTLVLVPSISLVAQLYREWANNSSKSFNFYPIFICSDYTVADKEEENEKIIETAGELGFPVTISAQDLLEQLSSIDGKKVIFSTYHSSPVIKEACQLNASLNFDLAIADEAHRCAGKARSAFATIVDRAAIRTKHKIFMTATPKIFSDHVKKATRELEYEIVSMDDEEKFGPVFHKLPFSQAIAQKLLSDYQVVISIMDNKTYQEYAERGRFVAINEHETDARTLASQLLVAKAIKQYALQKVITFHNRKKNAEQFIRQFPVAQSLLSNDERPVEGSSDVVFGEMSQSERINILNKFKEVSAGCSLLGSVKCLSEGVDVPALDGIAFIDPKGSEIDIVQAVGRVIRKPPNQEQKIGTIIIPIFVDGSVDEIVALENSCFQPVWKVIKALRAHDDILAEQIDNYRLELGKRSKNKPIKLSNKIIINVPLRLEKDFASALNIKLIERCAVVSLAMSHPEIAAQWHPDKNGGLSPGDITPGSGKKIWWLCSKGSDHEWETSIQNRTYGYGCPVCANQLIVSSNCLTTTHPEIAKQWHSTKNDGLTPNDIGAGSPKKVWWKCSIADDHVWKTSIEKRTAGTGCPACNGKLIVPSNCLATRYPKIAKEWHPTKNAALTSNDVYSSSSKKVWWKCPIAEDHEWETSIEKRTTGTGCPICANRLIVHSNCLATTHPETASQWHPAKNGPLMPNHISIGSNKKVWWKCSMGDDHEWKTSVAKRKKGDGCPICANRLVVFSNSLMATHPEIASQWHPAKNGTLSPNHIAIGSNKRVWWKCSMGDDHEWKTSPSRRKEGTGCPVCSRKLVVFSNCLSTTHPEIAKQWHSIKNGTLTPYGITAGSHKKIWWQCVENNTHEWETGCRDQIKSKTQCPFCEGNRQLCLVETDR